MTHTAKHTTASLQNHTLDELICKRKILILCGTGGVGKTTLSAALAIRAALQGKKTTVITIDPAKRLANALGLTTLSDQPTDISPQVFEAYRKNSIGKNKFELSSGAEDQNPGSLEAIVPDTKETFESFVKELAPNPQVAERVMQNPIFQIFAREFSGTNEYMALERLFALHQRGNSELIILDTPPSRNTLYFLHAPKLLAQFFDEKLIRWLILPSNRFLSAGIKKTLGVLENLTGSGFMSHLFEFAAALFEVQLKFSANLNKITSLLTSDQVGFLVVTTPTPVVLNEVQHFIEELKTHSFHFDGVLLNRTLHHLSPTSPNLNPNPSSDPQPVAYQIIEALQQGEAQVLENLMRNPIPLCATLPELARDVHTLEDLVHVAEALGHHNLAHNSTARTTPGTTS